MAQRYDTPPRISDPSASAGTRKQDDLEVSPARNTFTRHAYHTPPVDGGVSPQRPMSQQSGASPGWAPNSPSKSYANHKSDSTAGDGYIDGSAVEYDSASKARRDNVSRLWTEYSSVEEIGHGNFGVVMRAVHELDGCIYAIKRSNKPIQGDADLQHRLQEVYALSGCSGKGSSPYILRYYDAWIEDDGCVCIRTEYLEGGNLHSACVKKSSHVNPLCLVSSGSPSQLPHSSLPQLPDPCRVWEFLFQMSLALNSIHSNNSMAHLDVKPDNIFFSVHQNPPSDPEACAAPTVTVSYKLGDFGLARPTHSFNGELFKGLNDDEGDKRYLCPHLLQRKLPHCLKEADVFSLGASALEIMGCCGADAPEETILRSVQQRVMPAEAGNGEALAELIASMVRKDPTERPATIAIAIMSHDAINQLRKAAGRYVPLDEPEEIRKVRDLRAQIAEVEEQLRQLSTAGDGDDESSDRPHT